MLMHIGIEIRSWVNKHTIFILLSIRMFQNFNCLFFLFLQTLIHIAAIFSSIGAFFAFSLFYNAVCVNCMGLPGSYWVMQKAIGRHLYWLTIIISSIVAVLPRYFSYNKYVNIKCHL